MRLRVAFDDGLPVGRFGPLFHVLCLERPEVRLEWRPTGFPTSASPLLDGVDAGLFCEPPLDGQLRALTLDESPMSVLMATGHRLARRGVLEVADILDEPFPDGRDLHPTWRAFWTLDALRGGPPNTVGDPVLKAQDGLALVVAGRAIATVAAWVPDGVSHPGVISIPLVDGPTVATRLVWRSADERPVVQALAELALAWTRGVDRDAGTG